MRRYRGFIADSIRWQDFAFRDDDIVISTPSKCGTTWMQTIVGMLVLSRVDLGAPLSRLSPWLDMAIHSTEEQFQLLDAQTHRRWIKTHTPLDGLPWHDSVTYITVMRDPLDAALSNQDHEINADMERFTAMRRAASGDADLADLPQWTKPDDPTDYLRWWIDADVPPSGGGLNCLAELAHGVTVWWEARHRPNVGLFHYADLSEQRADEMARVAELLGIDVSTLPFDEMVAAADFGAMRDRASELAPEAHVGAWKSDRDFFRHGNRRRAAELLEVDDLIHFEERLRHLCGPAADWVLHGRSAL